MSDKHLEADDASPRGLDRFTLAPWNTVKTISGKVYTGGANSESVCEVTPKNASLVAAAPEMYEAASQPLHGLEGEGDIQPDMDKLYGALTKARSDSPDHRGESND